MAEQAVLSVRNRGWALGGEPFRFISGAIHYFRIHQACWEDRLEKARLCGLNTVETYVPWNAHEPRRGVFEFGGMFDLEAFVRLAGAHGLHVIVRPGPYICSEWEFGGLPAWLLADPTVRLRCMNRPYLAAVDAWYDELLRRLVPLQATKGGPIMAMQVENEYGSYGNDTAYLRCLADGMRARGVDVLLFTSDGPEPWMLTGGTLPPSDEVPATVNFGNRASEAFDALRRFRGFTPAPGAKGEAPSVPLACMEYWNGWFDHWGEPHHSRDAGDAAQVLDDILSAGASVNLYMFAGGTNFGFFNGANHGGCYQPTITSYDYDAALDECGDCTEKYRRFREVISRNAPVPDEPLPPPSVKASYGTVRMERLGGLFENLERLGDRHTRVTPESMEQFGQSYGFILYRTRIHGPRSKAVLHLQEVRDRALVLLDGTPLGVIGRDEQSDIGIEVPAGSSALLDILVENLGRINYGPHLADRKGITEGVRLGNQFLYGWEIHTLPLDAPPTGLSNQGSASPGPAFYRGYFGTGSAGPADTFLKLDGWTKGVCYINGFILGRYWNVGPQRTLYIPAPLLRDGRNELVVFELHGFAESGGGAPEVMLVNRPLLG